MIDYGLFERDDIIYVPKDDVIQRRCRSHRARSDGAKRSGQELRRSLIPRR